MRRARRRVRICGAIMLTAVFGTLAWADSLPANVVSDLDRNINEKGTDGYVAKGWLYKTDTREFIFYVRNGDKCLSEYMANPDLPLHSVAKALTAHTIIEASPLLPAPRVYIFKDGERELCAHAIFRPQRHSCLRMISSRG